MRPRAWYLPALLQRLDASLLEPSIVLDLIRRLVHIDVARPDAHSLCILIRPVHGNMVCLPHVPVIVRPLRLVRLPMDLFFVLSF
jgi:hypothetical protein